MSEDKCTDQGDTDDGQSEQRYDLKEAARDIVDDPHAEESGEKQGGVIVEYAPIVTALIGQTAGGTEFLYQRNGDDEEVNDPYHRVSLEYASGFEHLFRIGNKVCVIGNNG